MAQILISLQKGIFEQAIWVDGTTSLVWAWESSGDWGRGSSQTRLIKGSETGLNIILPLMGNIWERHEGGHSSPVNGHLFPGITEPRKALVGALLSECQRPPFPPNLSCQPRHPQLWPLSLLNQPHVSLRFKITAGPS